ncbi:MULTISPECIES: hypothetical protein [Burkholderiaceae]|uniref:hypothetical protein n=1 Tax=Burkholderiaceae TaxID=119060 RepID=UPI0005E99332|nr:hypothetical protein [Burkholderia pseudomallei]CAK0115939.1 Uncharacterised protein [Burkholderia pseudomallei]CAK0121982.1 Uncharacterised protein [Burkholderia pseudomallei]CFW00317.1 Uncharacterised protein [Burkholderia pseudomallei]CPH80903.1 Uncharacterised protein [Burkholderia pseudomallei]
MSRYSAAQIEARRRFALAFRRENRPDLTHILGNGWSLGQDMGHMTEQQYFEKAVQLFNRRVGIARFAPSTKHDLFRVAGV